MIELNIFTNCIPTSPNIEIIKETYDSFVKTFGNIQTTIYLDPHPLEANFEPYRANLEQYFKCKIIKTNSLSDGYIKSIKNSKADYLFQLEHDWSFNSDLIKHSLNEITEVMAKRDIYHFRFSKHHNTLKPELMKWQTVMNERECDGLKYCETDNVSNNPHIIDRKKYLEFLDRIELSTGSKGIEEKLTKKGLIGCQYGGLDYPPTIKHLQGKKTLCV
jgi:hypothetical protein